MQLKEFKIRCSAIGKIMTNPRSKTDLLSKTTMTFVEEWVKEQIYNRKKEFSSKYTDKGNSTEEGSIDFVAEQLDYGMLIKNEKQFEDDDMTGTPDVVPSDCVIDVKNPWDVFTFPLFTDEVPNKDYWWQGQGYMALTGRSKYKLIYVLSDTPSNLIEKEAYYWCKDNGFEDLDINIYNEFREKMTYPDIPAELKIKVFEFERDEEAIKQVRERVEEIRKYIATIKYK